MHFTHQILNQAEKPNLERKLMIGQSMPPPNLPHIVSNAIQARLEKLGHMLSKYPKSSWAVAHASGLGPAVQHIPLQRAAWSCCWCCSKQVAASWASLYSTHQDHPWLSSSRMPSDLSSPCLSWSTCWGPGPWHPASNAFSQAVVWELLTLKNISLQVTGASKDGVCSTKALLAASCISLAWGSKAISKAKESVSSSFLTPTFHILKPLLQQSTLLSICPDLFWGCTRRSHGFSSVL